MQDYPFFGYQSNEALHLSDREREIVLVWFSKIAYELVVMQSLHSKQTGIPVKTLRYRATLETKKARLQRKKMGAGFLPAGICDEPAEPPCQIIIEFPKKIPITLGGSVRAEFIKELLS
jgi:hypothetical protein